MTKTERKARLEELARTTGIAAVVEMGKKFGLRWVQRAFKHVKAATRESEDWEAACDLLEKRADLSRSQAIAFMFYRRRIELLEIEIQREALDVDLDDIRIIKK
jgi:hypothetical protein